MNLPSADPTGEKGFCEARQSERGKRDKETGWITAEGAEDAVTREADKVAF